MKFNISKWGVVKIGKGANRLSYGYKMRNKLIAKKKSEKDLGITWTDNHQRNL